MWLASYVKCGARESPFYCFDAGYCWISCISIGWSNIIHKTLSFVVKERVACNFTSMQRVRSFGMNKMNTQKEQRFLQRYYYIIYSYSYSSCSCPSEPTRLHLCTWLQKLSNNHYNNTVYKSFTNFWSLRKRKETKLSYFGYMLLLFFWVSFEFWFVILIGVLYTCGVWIESVDPIADLCLTNQILYGNILSSTAE